jgi:hypothetical protein
VIEASLRFPFRGDHAIVALLAGGGLLLAGALIYVLGVALSVVFVGVFLLPLTLVPRLLVDGYLVRLLRASAHDADGVPPFDDPVRLLTDGLKVFAINLGYGIVVMVAGVPLFVGVALALGTTAETASDAASSTAAPLSGAEGVLLVGGGLLFVAVVFVVLYLRSLSIASFAVADDLSAAFSADRLKRAGSSRTFVVAWLAAIAVRVVGTFVGGLLLVLLVGFVVQFYTQEVVFGLYGRAFADAVGVEGNGDGPSDSPADGGDGSRPDGASEVAPR